jgi:hypothetical protein
LQLRSSFPAQAMVEVVPTLRAHPSSATLANRLPAHLMAATAMPKTHYATRLHTNPYITLAQK